jgi:hypothetical protein
MSRIRLYYMLEAALCGGPVTGAAIFSFPWLVLGPLLMFSQSPVSAVSSFLWLAGSVCALGAFWNLVFTTVTGREHRFGVLFWLGVVGAVFALSEVAMWSDGFAALVFFFAPVACAAHFTYLQRFKVRT